VGTSTWCCRKAGGQGSRQVLAFAELNGDLSVTCVTQTTTRGVSADWQKNLATVVLVVLHTHTHTWDTITVRVWYDLSTSCVPSLSYEKSATNVLIITHINLLCGILTRVESTNIRTEQYVTVAYWIPVYTTQPVIKPDEQPVCPPVECLYTRCSRLFNRLSNRLFNRFENRFYRVNGVWQCT